MELSHIFSMLYNLTVRVKYIYHAIVLGIIIFTTLSKPSRQTFQKTDCGSLSRVKFKYSYIENL